MMTAPKVSRDKAEEFNWRAFDAYLFDIDGTLLHSRDGVHYEAYLAAMEGLYAGQHRSAHIAGRAGAGRNLRG
jgi:beta-phosphoglucomutase-like phosphatase (HAD superfamily)